MGHVVRKVSHSQRRTWDGRHRFEHWYADNQVYFITARCRDWVFAFEPREARDVFWNRLTHYAEQAGFVPWIASLVPNHYHVLGYNRSGESLGPMMQRLHGSVAKLVNDLLTERLVPFWRERGTHQTYFDGCIRNEVQCRRAYRYVQRQSVRHRLAKRWEDYPDTRVWIDLDRGVRRAMEIGAFLGGVPYKRYEGCKE